MVYFVVVIKECGAEIRCSEWIAIANRHLRNASSISQMVYLLTVLSTEIYE